jgi:hypothetical protein
MIYYLDNDDKFILYDSPQDIIFCHYCSTLERATTRDMRWIDKSAFSRDHMDKIHKYLQSDDEGNRNIGKTIVEQTLKVIINGQVIGYVGQ